MHPEVRKFVEAFNERMERAGRKVRLNEIETMYLQEIHGPEFSFNFSGLTAQFPIKDYKGGNRFIDFYFEWGVVRIIVEIDSYKFHVAEQTAQQYDDHQERQNDMILNNGWILLRFTANMIMKKPMVCRRQLMQAVGKCLVMSQQHQISSLDQLWLRRKSEILGIANNEGRITVSKIARRFSVDRKTATKWLKKMTADGELLPIRTNQLITGYALPNDNRQDRN